LNCDLSSPVLNELIRPRTAKLPNLLNTKTFVWPRAAGRAPHGMRRGRRGAKSRSRSQVGDLAPGAPQCRDVRPQWAGKRKSAQTGRDGYSTAYLLYFFGKKCPAQSEETRHLQTLIRHRGPVLREQYRSWGSKRWWPWSGASLGEPSVLDPPFPLPAEGHKHPKNRVF